MPLTTDEDKAKGERAEEVANWYFRLNGFLLLPSYILHLNRDESRVTLDGEPKPKRTDVDLLGVRFPRSAEYIYRGNQKAFMVDDERLTSLSKGNSTNDSPRTVFAIVEVKSSNCAVNGPWNEPENMRRAISRLGFAHPDSIGTIADAMYPVMRWSDDRYVLQYICVGKTKTERLVNRHAGLVQIDFDDIGEFLFNRFGSFPQEKLPSRHVHEQWPSFGRCYAEWFLGNRGARDSAVLSGEAIKNYIESDRMT